MQQQWEMEGLQNIESAVAESEAEVLYRLLRGAVSHSPISSIPSPPNKCHHTPTATISKPLPQESEVIKPEASAPVVGRVELALEAPFSAVSQALEVAICSHMAPLCLQFGCQKGIQMLG